MQGNTWLLRKSSRKVVMGRDVGEYMAIKEVKQTMVMTIVFPYISPLMLVMFPSCCPSSGLTMNQEYKQTRNRRQLCPYVPSAMLGFVVTALLGPSGDGHCENGRSVVKVFSKKIITAATMRIMTRQLGCISCELVWRALAKWIRQRQRKAKKCRF